MRFPAYLIAFLFLFVGISAADSVSDCRQLEDNGVPPQNEDDLRRWLAACADVIEDNESSSELAWAYVNRGTAYGWLAYSFGHPENYEDAIADFNEAISLDDKNANVFYKRGFVYQNLKDFEQAIADYDRAVALNPRLLAAYNNRGNAYRKLMDFERAIEDYDRAISLNLEFVRGYNNRGNSFFDLKDFERAIADYDRAISLDRDYKYAYSNRGRAYIELEDYDRAIADLEMAITLDSEYASAYNNLAWLYFKLGEAEQGWPLAEIAVTLDPELAEAYGTRAHIHEALGNIPEAIRDYRRALELDPTIKEDRQGLERLTGEAQPIPSDDTSPVQGDVQPRVEPAETGNLIDPALLMDHRFAVFQGQAAAPNTLIFFHNAEDMEAGFQVLQEPLLYRLIEAGQLRVENYFIFSGSHSSLYGNLALICAGPEGFRSVSAFLRSGHGTRERRVLDERKDLEQFRLILNNMYVNAGLEPALVDACAMKRPFVETYMADFEAKRRAASGHAIASAYYSWPFFVLNGKRVAPERINEALMEAAPGTGASDAPELESLERLPAHLKGVWTSTPALCGEYLDRVRTPEHLDMAFNYIAPPDTPNANLYLVTTRRIKLHDDGDTQCMFEDLSGNAERTRIQMSCFNIVNPSETYERVLDIVPKATAATFEWTIGPNLTHNKTLVQCATLSDLSAFFNAVWSFDQTGCRATTRLYAYDLVFQRATSGDLALTIATNRDRRLPDAPFEAVVYVDDIRLSSGRTVQSGNRAVIPLGPFAQATDLVSGGMFMSVWSQRIVERNLGEHRLPILETPLLGSSRAMQFLRQCEAGRE